MENSKIEWTTHTFNPWIGCTKVSSGCLNCYAEALMDVRYGKVEWGPSGVRTRTADSNWRKPLQWDRAAAAAGERHRVFCASLADVFEDREELKPWRRELFALIDRTPNLDWLLLTKRPENIPGDWPGGYRQNVWLGTSIEDQKQADIRVHHLYHGGRKLSPVLFLSIEPLLGPLKLNHAYDGDKVRFWFGGSGINWVIVGGESGPNARPIHSAWVRELRDECTAAGVPFFFKQWGEWLPIDSYSPFIHGQNPDRYTQLCLYEDGSAIPDRTREDLPILVYRVGKKIAGREIDEREWSEFPVPSAAACSL